MATNEEGPPEDYLKAEALLRMSTNEFKKENYGGSLYLAGQAQNQIRAIQSNLSHQADYSLIPGRSPVCPAAATQSIDTQQFAPGPVSTFQDNRTLEEGTMIIGYSYKDDWIRVHTEDGGQGWVFQTLVGGR